MKEWGGWLLAKARALVCAMLWVIRRVLWSKASALRTKWLQVNNGPWMREVRRKQAPSHGRRKPDWVREGVLALARRLPDAGYRTLAHSFNLQNSHLVEQHGKVVLVSKSFVAQLIRQYRLDMQAKPRPCGARTEPIQTTWGMDLTGLPLASGGTAPVFGLIDHGSRALLALTPVVRYNSLVLLGQLLVAIGTHGKPRAVRSDNDAVFKTPVFRIALALLGVQQQFTAPGSPWQNGRIERFWRTLKTELQTNTVNTRFQGQPIQTRMKLASVFTMHVLLDAFKSSYNYDRPHQSLKGQTPAMVWTSELPKARAKLKSKTSRSKPPS
jgi:putative transposase